MSSDLVATGIQWMLLIMGGLFVVLPLFVVLWKLAFRLRCHVAEGTVLRMEEWFDEESDSKRLSPVIHFRTSQGREMEIRPGIGYGLKYLPAVNSTVTVYYIPDTPERAQIASRGLWEVSGILILVGALLFLMGFLPGVL